MAMICYRVQKCQDCPHYKESVEEGAKVCCAKQEIPEQVSKVGIGSEVIVDLGYKFGNTIVQAVIKDIMTVPACGGESELISIGVKEVLYVQKSYQKSETLGFSLHNMIEYNYSIGIERTQVLDVLL